MLESISSLKDKVASGLYKRQPVYNFDITEIMNELRQDAFYDKFPDDQLIVYAIETGLKRYDVQTEVIVENLKKQEGFKNFTEDQLYEYAYSLQGKNSMSMHLAVMHSFQDNSRPNDPFWSQYSYEEILEMEAAGVDVPDEFLEWAHGMQDSNTTDFEIAEDSSDDQNTAEKIDSETNNRNQADTQKRAQAYYSQADKQQELIGEKCDETETLAQNVVDRQENLAEEQKSTIEETNTKLEEWKLLDEKAKNGTLTAAEKNRYNELGMELSNSQNSAQSELEKLDTDIDELVSQMNDITMLIDVNDKINVELEHASLRMSTFEGNKKRGYLGDKKTSGDTSVTALMGSQAMGGNVARGAAVKDTLLNSANIDIKNDQEQNVSISNEAVERLHEAKQMIQNNQLENLNIMINPSPVEEKDDDEPAKTDKTENSEENNNDEAGQQNSLNSKSVADTLSDKVSVDNETSEPVVTDEYKPTDENPSTTATETSNPEDITVKTPTATSTDEAAEATPVEGEIFTDETTTAEADSEQENPMKALTMEYLNTCNSKQTEMESASAEVKSLFSQVTELKDTKFIDSVKLYAGFNKKFKEYEKFAKKAASGQELTSGDLAEISQLEAYLNTENGEYATSIQSKLNILNSYNTALDNLNQLSEDNKTYGTEAVAQGKIYAESEMGDKSDVKIKSGYILLNKEKRYDLLYGKSGESLGRDLIDSGESLTKNASSNLKFAKNIIYKSVSNFADEYSESLNNMLTKITSSVAPVQADISSAIAQQNAEQETEENITGESAVDDTGSNDIVANSAVPEPEKQVVTEQDLMQDETTNPANTSDNVNSKIITNLKNAAKIISLNNENKTLTNRIKSYMDLSKQADNSEETTISQDEEISLSENSIFKAVNSDVIKKIAEAKSQNSLISRLTKSVEANSNNISNIANESLQNTPVFNEENADERIAYNASVSAVNIAANAADTNTTNLSLNSTVTADSQKSALKPASNIQPPVEPEMTPEEDKNDVDTAVVETETDDVSVEIPEEDAEDVSDGETFDEDAVPVNVDKNVTENDLEKMCLDEMYKESDEDAAILNNNSSKLYMEKLAREAAKTALNENVEKGGFNVSASATASLGDKLNNDNQKSETGRTRRLISYENKNRRAALADKVENSKKVVMKRGKKKNS